MMGKLAVFGLLGIGLLLFFYCFDAAATLMETLSSVALTVVPSLEGTFWETFLNHATILTFVGGILIAAAWAYGKLRGHKTEGD